MTKPFDKIQEKTQKDIDKAIQENIARINGGADKVMELLRSLDLSIKDVNMVLKVTAQTLDNQIGQNKLVDVLPKVEPKKVEVEEPKPTEAVAEESNAEVTPEPTTEPAS